MAMSKSQFDFIQNLRKTVEKKDLPEKIKKMRHINTIGAPGIILAESEDKYMMELSSGSSGWYDKCDVSEYPSNV